MKLVKTVTPGSYAIENWHLSSSGNVWHLCGRTGSYLCFVRCSGRHSVQNLRFLPEGSRLFAVWISFSSEWALPDRKEFVDYFGTVPRYWLVTSKMWKIIRMIHFLVFATYGSKISYWSCPLCPCAYCVLLQKLGALPRRV